MKKYEKWSYGIAILSGIIFTLSVPFLMLHPITALSLLVTSTFVFLIAFLVYIIGVYIDKLNDR